jgi:HK97 gp10 family phage protein
MRLMVQLKGVDALSLVTQKLINAARDGAKAAVSDAAQLFVEEAQALVPVDTGHLRDSIHAELVESTDTRTVVAVSPAYEDSSEQVGFEPAYARRIEFGFMGSDSLGRVYHQAAQPFMRPAWDNKQEEARQLIKEGIYQELDAAMVKR